MEFVAIYRRQNFQDKTHYSIIVNEINVGNTNDMSANDVSFFVKYRPKDGR